MPTFDTPTPIDLSINLPVGAIEIVASDRTDTVVTVIPTNPDKAVDRRCADETKVEFDGQRLTIQGPKPRLSFIGPTESVDVRVELPTGSRLTAEISVGGVRTEGRLGATRVKGTIGAVDWQHRSQTGEWRMRDQSGRLTGMFTGPGAGAGQGSPFGPGAFGPGSPYDSRTRDGDLDDEDVIDGEVLGEEIVGDDDDEPSSTRRELDR